MLQIENSDSIDRKALYYRWETAMLQIENSDSIDRKL